MPRELEATTTVHMERMSDAQLEAIIAQGIEGGLDPAATDEDTQIIQWIGAPLQRRACAALIVFLPFTPTVLERADD
jgi:hypothetical protein